MEIKNIAYTTIRLKENEREYFKEIIIKCIREAIKPGFKNMFSPEEKGILIDLAKCLELKIDDELFITLAADTHTRQQFND